MMPKKNAQKVEKNASSDVFGQFGWEGSKDGRARVMATGFGLEP